MDRAGRLKELQTVLRYLHGQKIDEQAAYDQLRDDPRFEGWIRLPKVQIIYKQLSSERAKSAKTSSSKPLIEEPPISIVNQIKNRAIPFFKAILQCNHEIHPCLKNFWGSSFDGRFMIYDYHSQTSDDSCTFLLHDAFSNKERYVKFQKAPDANLIYFMLLNADLGLSVELDEGFLSLNLFELDWTVEIMQAIHTIRFPCENFLGFVCDGSDSTRFVYVNEVQPVGASTQFYKIENNEIILGHSNFLESWSRFCPSLFFDGKLYGFEYHDELGRLSSLSICVNNFEPNAQTSVFALEWPSNNFHVFFSNDVMTYSWIRDRLYAVVKFDEDDTFGIAWISCEMTEWTSLNFRTAELIIRLKFIVEGSILLVQTDDGETELEGTNIHQLKRTFYRIPFKKPEALTYLAWAALVHSKSKIP